MTTSYIERPSALLDEAVVLRRCALWRSAFKRFSVSYPAELLSFEPVAVWMRRHRITVDVVTAAEFNLALASGIRSAQLVMHPRNAAAIACAGTGLPARLVVDAAQQAVAVALGAQRNEHVLVGAGREMPSVVAEVLRHQQLDLVGLHCTADPSCDALGLGALRTALADMAMIRRRHAVLLSRISLAGFDGGLFTLHPRALRRVADALGEVVEEQCARYRFPRPALTVSPSVHVLLPRDVNAA
ncbi:hypothetical protein A5792_17285 [Mycolicibacterium peregrinum]|uniref:Orn/DAP/Arg decarboxylase 2 N-terminal domain-containing protein n=1 Tax=Mycolicibacterium peregrinum TaxID=43304 RepID=A0A1A0RBM8_MYCPR|nr:hypothetical protein [Mycolicibacterium peregrinum]OBB31129.1 hypothetical protein A5792_17285 [Mycolicibacterium peregrinum]